MPKNFPYTESELLEIASRFNKSLKEHFHDLEGFSDELNREFIFRFKASFYKSRIHPADQGPDLFTHKNKEELNDLVTTAQNLFQNFRYYIQKAFPYDSELWEPFGYCEVHNAAHDYDKLLHCLEDFIKMIKSKKHELLAVQCPEKSFNEIQDIFEKIQEKHDEIQKINHAKVAARESRINSLNKLYKLMQLVHNAAEARLQDDPQTLEKLTFPVSEKQK
jgi:hypothetical protein